MTSIFISMALPSAVWGWRFILTRSRRPGIPIWVRRFMSWRFASGLQKRTDGYVTKGFWDNAELLQKPMWEKEQAFIVPSSPVCGVFPGHTCAPSGWTLLARGCRECDAEGRDLQSCSSDCEEHLWLTAVPRPTGDTVTYTVVVKGIGALGKYVWKMCEKCEFSQHTVGKNIGTPKILISEIYLKNMCANMKEPSHDSVSQKYKYEEHNRKFSCASIRSCL